MNQSWECDQLSYPGKERGEMEPHMPGLMAARSTSKPLQAGAPHLGGGVRGQEECS